MEQFKVNVKALAYEKSHPKTKLSEFENDSDFATQQQLLEEIAQLRDWILANGFTAPVAVASQGGDLNAASITSHGNLAVGTKVDGGDITQRYSLPLRFYYFSGDIKSKSEEID